MAIDNEFAAVAGKPSVSTGKLTKNSKWKHQIRQRLYDVNEMIDNHVERMHTSVTENVKQTIKFIQNAQKSSSRKRPTGGRQTAKLDPSMYAIQRLWDQVASAEESEESDVAMAFDNRHINVKQREYKPRLTKGEEEELKILRPIKRIATNVILPSGKMVLIDAQINRFKRQSSKRVNDLFE